MQFRAMVIWLEAMTGSGTVTSIEALGDHAVVWLAQELMKGTDTVSFCKYRDQGYGSLVTRRSVGAARH